MSWFSNTFSLSGAPSPEQDEIGERDQDDDGSSAKGVSDEFSELTKNLTRSLWGVASFLAPPPSNEVGSPEHTHTPQTETHSMTIAGNLEDPQAAVDVDAKEGNEDPGSSPVAALAGPESPNLGDKNFVGMSNSSPSGDKLTGIRSDLAELRGTMATGFSRIQTVIRAVTEDEDDDEDLEDDVAENSPAGGSVSGLPQNLGDEMPRHNGLSSLLKPLLVSMSSFRERFPRSERGENSPLVAGGHGEADMDYEIQPKLTGRSSLGGSIGGLSRLATSFIPYARDIVGEISGRDYYAVALTDEVVAFADNIAAHPETWLDFPLTEEEDADDFEMTDIQQEHAKAVEELSSRLAAVHRELSPAFISDGRFWKVYYVLLHSRLSKEDAELLSTSQVLKSRELLLQSQKAEPRNFDTAPTESEREEPGLTESNMVALPLKPSAECASLAIMEEGSVDDASHPKSESYQESLSGETDVQKEIPESSSVHFAALKLVDEEGDVDAWLDDEDNEMQETADRGPPGSMHEDVSFSDLEDDDDECSKGEDGSHGVKRDGTSDQASHEDVSCGSKHEGDWLTVNKEDVASVTSSSP